MTNATLPTRPVPDGTARVFVVELQPGDVLYGTLEVVEHVERVTGDETKVIMTSGFFSYYRRADSTVLVMSPTIRVWTVAKRRDWDDDDGEPETISEASEDYSAVPDEDDADDGMTVVDVAVRIIRDRHYISGPESPSQGPGFAPGIWYSAEIYERPDGTYEEVTAHLDGFTPEQERAIWERVTKR